MLPLRARLAAARPGALAYRTTLEQIPSDLGALDARLARPIVYPVKGLGGIAVERARLDARGLADETTGLADRGVLLAALRPGSTPEGDAFDGFAVSNRLEGTLALVRARQEGGSLVYRAPGLPELRLDPASLRPRAGEPVRVRLYDGGDVVEGVRDDGPLADWVRQLLRAHPARRRFEPEDLAAILPRAGSERPVARKHRAGEPAQTWFGDGGHVLVASQSTLAWMNGHIVAKGGRSVAMEAFRPNLVVEGWPANAEDLVGEINVAGPAGPVPFVFATLSTRCDATRVDLSTGRKPDKEPLAFLARERPPRDDDPTSATFAVNAVARAEAFSRTLHAGDAVRVLSERA